MNYLRLLGLLLVMLSSVLVAHVSAQGKDSLLVEASFNLDQIQLSTFAESIRKRTGLEVSVHCEDMTLSAGSYQQLSLGVLIRTILEKNGLSCGYDETQGISIYREGDDVQSFRSGNAHGHPDLLLHSRIEIRDQEKFSLDPTYIPALADASSWESVYRRDPYLYFGIGQFSDQSIKDDELSQLAAVVKRLNLRVAIEAGGLRFVNAADFDDQGGERQARKETKKMMRWIEAGGVVNEVIADHAIMHHIAMNHRDKEFRCQRTEPLPAGKEHLKFTFDGLYSELMDYFLAVKEKIPECEFGVVSSLGYFTFSDEGEVLFGPKSLPAWEYSDYVDGLLAAAKAKGVTLTHIDVDSSHGSAWLEALKKGEEGLSVERIAMAVRIIQSRGLKAGLFYQGSTNWKFISKYLPEIEQDDSFDTCVRRLDQFAAALHKAGVKPDRVIMRRGGEAQVYTHGPESKHGTYFNLVKELLDEQQRLENSRR